jgi:hypothetical protein
MKVMTRASTCSYIRPPLINNQWCTQTKFDWYTGCITYNVSPTTMTYCTINTKWETVSPVHWTHNVHRDIGMNANWLLGCCCRQLRRSDQGAFTSGRSAHLSRLLLFVQHLAMHFWGKCWIRHSWCQLYNRNNFTHLRHIHPFLGNDPINTFPREPTRSTTGRIVLGDRSVNKHSRR